MKKYQLNLDDIEEVGSFPNRRRRHNHIHYNAQNDYKTVNIKYDNNHLHQSNHYHNDNYNIQVNENSNYQEHRRRHRHPHWNEFGFKQILLMIVFGICISVLFLSFLVNLILTIKQVVTPRIFIPSIILMFLSLIFSGGIMGTYIEPPNGRRRQLKSNELLLMRTLVPTIMLIVSLIFLLIGGENVKSLIKDIHKAEDLCNSNKGLSMQEIYIKTNETTNDLIIKKDNLIYSNKNDLFCYPKAKCVKLNKDSKEYICNSQDFITDESSNIKCDNINLNENMNQLFNNLKFQKDAILFTENCIDVHKNFLKSENKIFKCESENNLEIIQFSKNLTQVNDKKFESYLNNKTKKLREEFKKGKEVIFKYENSRYDYDLDCLKNIDYKFSYLLLNIYLYIFYLICIFWILFGIYSMHNLINLGVEGKLNFLKNIDDEERYNYNNNRNINRIEEDAEGNQLINNNK